MSKSKYVLLNLKGILKAIGSVSASHVDEIQGKCTCGRWLDQDMDKCPDCDLPVIWEESYTWEKSYGSPRQARAIYDVFEPECDSGKELCRLADVDGFPTKIGAKLWCDYEQMYGEEEAMRSVRYIINTKRESGTNAMYHAIAIAKRKVSEGKEQRHGYKDKPATPRAEAPSRWN